MTGLLDLAEQGDVGTVADEGSLRGLKLMGPQQLYELWERQPWSAHAIDLARDRRDWEQLSGGQRRELGWALSTFFVAEERVTTQFSGLVRAYESQAEEAFLTTQQVDEARHAQHFNRLHHEVIGFDGTFEEGLERARRALSPAFIELFDGHLVEAQSRLLRDPGDEEAKVDFVTLYHMVIEGMLALTGQHLVTDYLEKREILPGCTRGFRNVSQDEHRHVAYGTWYLQRKAQDAAVGRRIGERIRDVLPLAGAVLVPRRQEPGTGSYEFLGYSAQQRHQLAFRALSRRLKVIGVPSVP